MNVGVIGTGGVGGYFGGKLAKAYEGSTEVKVHFVARGEHYEKIRSDGLLLDSQQGSFVCRPASIVNDIRNLPELDAVLVCVKAYDLDDAAYRLRDKVWSRTVVLPLLNGVDIHSRLKNVLREPAVLPSCVYVGTRIERPGKVVQRGGTCVIHFGDDPSGRETDRRFFELLDGSGIEYRHTPDPYPEIWTKFMFIAAFGLVGAESGKTLGEMTSDEKLSADVLSVMREISVLAAAQGVSLPPDAVSSSFRKAGNFPPDTKTSFQRDFETAGRLDERDLFGGTILRLGDEYGIPVEATRKIFTELAGRKPD